MRKRILNILKALALVLILLSLILLFSASTANGKNASALKLKSQERVQVYRNSENNSLQKIENGKAKNRKTISRFHDKNKQ